MDTYHETKRAYSHDNKNTYIVMVRKCLKCGRKLGLSDFKQCCGHTYTIDSLTKLEPTRVLAFSYEDAVKLANN